MAHAFGGSGRLSVLAGVSPLASRFEESDAMCQLAAKMHKGVRCRPCAVATHYASEVAAADGDVVELEIQGIGVLRNRFVKTPN